MPDSHPSDGPAEDSSAHLAQALREVYGASPTDFMAVRKKLAAAAKADGDAAGAKAIGTLRKPSMAAWAVNLLARQDPELVEELVELGARMRGAQARLDTATLTSLRPERDRIVTAVVAAAAALVSEAGRTLSASGQDDVRGTVIAALADEQASTAVTSGQLTRALSYSGFGEVDLSEAVVRTSSGSILSVVRDRPGAQAAHGGGARKGSTARPATARRANAEPPTTRPRTTTPRTTTARTTTRRPTGWPAPRPSSRQPPRPTPRPRPRSPGLASVPRTPATASRWWSASSPRPARPTNGRSRP